MNSRNQHESMEYFDNLSDDYVRLIVDTQKQIYRNVNPVLTRRVRGRVLSLGSGPVMNFAATNADHVVCLDISHNMLAKLPKIDKLDRVCADAQFLPFDIAAFDVVVVPFLIHHMAQDSTLMTDKAITHMFSEANRVLRRDGRVIIVDLFIPGILETFERTLFSPTCLLLNKFSKPMMYFYSISNFKEILYNARLAMQFDQLVQMQEKIMPTLLLPKFKIPARAHPARFHIIEAVKIP
jgi:ubiquinone/menaquinone biosynthesis C-methylase UbiE